MRRTLPDNLTWSRLWFGGATSGIPCLFHCWWLMLVAFIIMCIWELSDLLDGFLARLWHQTSDWGKVNDPRADVFFHVPLFLIMTHLGRIPWWVCGTICAREIMITVGRHFMASTGNGAHGAKTLGKFKTWSYGICLGYAILQEMFLLHNPEAIPGFFQNEWASIGIPSVATTLSVISGVMYLHNFWTKIRKPKQEM